MRKPMPGWRREMAVLMKVLRSQAREVNMKEEDSRATVIYLRGAQWGTRQALKSYRKIVKGLR